MTLLSRRSVEHGLTILLFVGLAVFALHRIAALDVWWQIGAGEWIVHHGIPRVDPFSYGFPGGSWLEPRWLYCASAYLIAEHLGLNFLILAKLLVLGAMLALLLLAPGTGARWAALAGGTLALLAGHERFLVRPELLSFLGLTFVLYAIGRFERDADRRWLFALPVVQLVWCNAHTLWILGPATLIIYLLARLTASRFRLDGLRPLMQATGLVSVVTLINPYLFEGIAFPFLLFRELGAGHYLGQAISEFHGPFSSLLFGWNYRTAAFLAVLLVSAAAFAFNARRVPLGRFVLWAVYLVLALRATRNVALFGLVAGFATALNLSEIELGRRDTRAARWLPGVVLALVAALLVGMIPYVATDRLYRDQGWSRRFGFGVSDHLYPIRALAFARAQGLPMPVLNSLGDGGYVLFEGGEGSVFIDGRLEVYGAERLAGAIELTRSGRGITEQAERLGVRSVLVGNTFRHRGLLATLEASPDWVPVYYDHLHQLYLRVLPETRPLVDRLGIDWSRPPRFDVPRPAAIAPADWLPESWPRVADAYEVERLGSFFLAVGNFEQARERFEQAVAIDRSDVRSRLFLGLFRRAEGREVEAQALLAGVSRDDLERVEVNFLAGRILMWAERPEAAIEYYLRVIDAGQTHALYVESLARAAIAAERYALAVDVLSSLLEREPRAFDAWSLRGIAALRSGAPVEARRCIERSLAIRPDQPRLRRWLDDPELFPD